MGGSDSASRALASVRFEGGMSRADLLLKGVLAAGALYGVGAVGPYVRRALAAEETTEEEALNLLLTLEFLQSSLYNRMNEETGSKGEKIPLKDPEKELVEKLLGEEDEHVSAMEKQISALGGKPVKREGFNFAFAFRWYEAFLEIAATIESATVGGYNGAIPSLKSAEAR